MLKGLLVVSIFFLFAIASLPVEAASMSCPDLTGKYRIDGNLKVSVNFPDIMSATITLPKLLSLGVAAGEYFYFDEGGAFRDQLLESYLEIGELGSWKQNGCSFTIELDYLADSLIGFLAENGLVAEISGSTTMTGKISTRDGTNSGKFSLKFDVSSPVSGSISVSLSFKGIRVASDPISQSADSSMSLQIKNFISGILSILPRKEVPLHQ